MKNLRAICGNSCFNLETGAKCVALRPETANPTSINSTKGQVRPGPLLHFVVTRDTIIRYRKESAQTCFIQGMAVELGGK